MILLKWQYSKIWSFTIWHIPFLIVPYSPFPKSETLGPWHNWWIIGADCWIEKDLEPSPSPPNSPEDYWKSLPLLISISWPSLVTLWVVVQKIYSKMHCVSCTNTHRDVTDLVNHENIKNIKTWISWERNIIFRQNKKILTLCLRWHIRRSYCFIVEANFN